MVWDEVKTSCDSRLQQIYRGEGTLIPARDRGNVSLLIISNNRTHQQMGLTLRPYWSCGNAYKTQFSGGKFDCYFERSIDLSIEIYYTKRVRFYD